MIKLLQRLERTFWAAVWEASEYLEIGLGRFAPFVFERMIGTKGRLIDKEKR